MTIVENKLTSGLYTKLEQIFDDLTLMVDNAFTFFSRESQQAQDAIALQRFIVRKYLDLKGGERGEGGGKEEGGREERRWIGEWREVEGGGGGEGGEMDRGEEGGVRMGGRKGGEKEGGRKYLWSSLHVCSSGSGGPVLDVRDHVQKLLRGMLTQAVGSKVRVQSCSPFVPSIGALSAGG
jgi:hypothetical protein